MLRTLLIVAIALGLLAPAAAAAEDRPNVVVIETDDQTVADVAAMPRTRQLIGDQGVSFRNSFVSLSQCCPSRTTLLTGRYAHNHGVFSILPPFGGFERLDSSETLAVWLERAGYATVLLGKFLNHYGIRDPREVPPGWTEWHALVDPTTYRYDGYTFNDDGRLTRYGDAPSDYQTDVITARAEEIVRRRAAARPPFFLWVAYLAPHNGGPRESDDPPGTYSPVPAPRDRDAFAGAELPHGPAFDEADVSDKPRGIRRRPRLTPAAVAGIREVWQQRRESLRSVDEGVARIVAALRSAGALDNTLLIFTSDNGYLSGEHRVPTGKVLPYEPSIRVPLLVRGPGIPRGESRSQLVWNGDLAPTILAATGARAVWEPDGESLLPFVADPGLETGRDILLEAPRRHTGVERFVGLRSRTHVLVEHSTGERELYDVRRDPAELDNLAGSPGAATLEHELAARLDALRHCAGRSCRPQPRLTLAVDRRCRGGHATVRISGHDRRRVRQVRIGIDGRLGRHLRRPPFRGKLALRSVAGPVEVTARAVLADDRVITLSRGVACR
jgi:N-acetylglucosamine-6-sulfatase